MKLYVDKAAPNARLVLMFAAERRIDLTVVEIGTAKGDHRTARFLGMNPLGQVPVLELSGGLCISESMAICRYLDHVSDSPSLFGTGNEGRAVTHMWSRRVEQGLFIPAVEFGHHGHPAFRDEFDQIPAYAELNRTRAERTFGLLERQLAGSRFIAGTEVSVADVAAYCGVEVALLWELRFASSMKHLERWHAEIDARPSARIARYR